MANCNSCKPGSPQGYLDLIFKRQAEINQVIPVLELQQKKVFQNDLDVRSGDPATIYRSVSMRMHQTRGEQFNNLEDFWHRMNIDQKGQTGTPANDLCSAEYELLENQFGIEYSGREGFEKSLTSREICAKSLFVNAVDPDTFLAEEVKGLAIQTSDFKEDTARAILRRWSKKGYAIATTSGAPYTDLSTFGTTLPALANTSNLGVISIDYLMYLYYTQIVPNAQFYAVGYVNEMPLVKIYMTAQTFHTLFWENTFFRNIQQFSGDPRWAITSYGISSYDRFGPFIPVITDSVAQGELVNGVFKEYPNRLKIKAGQGFQWIPNQAWLNAKITSVIIPARDTATLYYPEYPDTLGSGTEFGKEPQNFEWVFNNIIDRTCNRYNLKGNFETHAEFALEKGLGAGYTIELYGFRKGIEYYMTYAKAPEQCKNEDACPPVENTGCPCPSFKCASSDRDGRIIVEFIGATTLAVGDTQVFILKDGTEVTLTVDKVYPQTKEVAFLVPTGSKLVPDDICSLHCKDEELSCESNKVSFGECTLQADTGIETVLRDHNIKCHLAGDVAIVTFHDGTTAEWTLAADADLTTREYIWADATDVTINTFKVCCERGGIVSIKCKNSATVNCPEATELLCDGTIQVPRMEEACKDC